MAITNASKLASYVGAAITADGASGIITATQFVGPLTGNVTGNISGTTGSFTGNVSVGGTLTYEDVTNVDSVGIITARSGIHVTGGNVGLGTNTPATKLNIKTDASDDGILLEKTDGTDIARLFHDATSTDARLDMFSGGSANIQLKANGVSHFSGGRVGINSTSPTYLFEVNHADQDGIQLRTSNTAESYINFSDGDDNDVGQISYDHATNHLAVRVNAAERMRIDSSGRLLHGTSSASAGAFGTVPFFHSASSGTTNVFQNFGGTTYPARIDLCKTRGTSANSHVVVQNNDTAGGIYFAGSDGTDYAVAAQIEAFVDGAPGNDDMPGRLVFSTTSDGAQYATERMRITSTGGIHFNNGEIIERVKITAGKLSDNTNIDLENGMVHHFTTTETTTSTPNIRVNSSTSLNSVMAIGDTISVTLITTAAAAAYSAQLTIDGGAVTERWNGGSAPTSGGSSGNDVITYQIIKTADATYTVLANVSNFA